MAQIAKQTGLGRESLYKALSLEGNPEFATILKVVIALGLHWHVVSNKNKQPIHNAVFYYQVNPC
jgi:DNA-binding phage protein